MTAILTFVPEQSGYGVTHPAQVISTELDGGAPRLRADRIRASGMINVSWLLDRSEYDVFMNFMIQSTLRGAMPFLIDLVTDAFRLVRHRCTIAPGTLQTSQVQGFMYRVSATLRAEQLISFMGPFTATAPDILTTPSGDLNALLAVPTLVQVVGFSLNDGVHPPITLDGIYGITSFPTANSIKLFNVAAINPDWTVLAGSYPAGPTANVANVLLFNSPT